jgi:hypothetical protein
MKNPWIAAILNFFTMGLGYIYNGKRVWLGVLWTVAAVLLTKVEFAVKVDAPSLYNMMFTAVLIANLAFAIDGYNEAKSIK